jgi:cytochrome c5
MPSTVRPEALAACALLAVSIAWPVALQAADESAIALADGAGRERVVAACSMCHSLDYIVMNSPFQDQTGWEKTVKKMATVYGAPLTAEETAAIVAYLTSHYGR